MLFCVGEVICSVGYYRRMKKQNTNNTQEKSSSKAIERPDPANVHTCGKRKYPCPSTYDHRFESMSDYAKFICLNKKSPRSRHAYYRQVRKLMEHFDADPATLTEEQVRDYFLFLILERHWKPASVRQAVAGLKAFYIDTLGLEPWRVFNEVNTSDNKTKPNCPTRCEIVRLLGQIPQKRYQIPVKLIYCCGLRLSECLSLTIHDIKRSEQKLIIHTSKGERDRVVPVAAEMISELGWYWKQHQHPILLFPAIGSGSQDSNKVRKRMGNAIAPMSHSAINLAIRKAANKANLKYGNPRNLRHSFGTHFCQAGGNLLKLQKIMGHSSIQTTMIYLHLTHEIEESSLDLIEDLYTGLSLPAEHRT